MTIDTMFRQTDFYSLSGPPAPGALGPAMHEPSKVLDFNYNPAQISQQQHTTDCLASKAMLVLTSLKI